MTETKQNKNSKNEEIEIAPYNVKKRMLGEMENYEAETVPYDTKKRIAGENEDYQTETVQVDIRKLVSGEFGNQRAETAPYDIRERIEEIQQEIFPQDILSQTAEPENALPQKTEESGSLQDITAQSKQYQESKGEFLNNLLAKLESGLGPEDTAFPEIMDLLLADRFPETDYIIKGIEKDFEWR